MSTILEALKKSQRERGKGQEGIPRLLGEGEFRPQRRAENSQIRRYKILFGVASGLGVVSVIVLAVVLLLKPGPTPPASDSAKDPGVLSSAAPAARPSGAANSEKSEARQELTNTTAPAPTPSPAPRVAQPEPASIAREAAAATATPPVERIVIPVVIETPAVRSPYSPKSEYAYPSPAQSNTSASNVARETTTPAPPSQPAPGVGSGPTVSSPRIKPPKGMEPEAVATPEPALARGPLFGLHIQGILWDPEKPIALINGEEVVPGSQIGGVKIVRIRNDQIIVEKDGLEYTLRY